ncbi:MAG: DsbA family protein [Anaerolineales bacterium]|nr:DsbA family protein [Anaerolineales bacterium]
MAKKSQIKERRRKQRQRQQLITGLVVIGAALIVTAILIWDSVRPIGDIIIPDPIDHPLAAGTGMGDPNAPVVIEEYSDYLCTFCQLFVEQTEPLIIQEYVATGKVYFIYRNYIRVADSEGPAGASLCAAEQDMFWEYHDILFANQSGHGSQAYTPRRLEAYADSIGLNLTQFNECVDNKEYQEELQKYHVQGVERGLESTPVFFINGKMIEGARSFDVFQQEIEAALAFIGES